MARKPKSKVETTYYEVLGLTRKFTAAQLRDSWRSLSRALHPDRTGDSTPEGVDAFATLSCAYAVLSDPASRRAYDAQLDLLTQPCAVCGGTGETYKQKGFSARQATCCLDCNGTGRAR